MRISLQTVAPLLLAVAIQDRPPIGTGGATDAAPAGRSEGKPRLGMTPAVVCSRVAGFEDYTPLPGARLTGEDKLKVYFRPLRFKVEPAGARYRAKLSEDGRVRRKGEKVALSREDKLLEYEDTFDSPTYQIYLANTIGLKDLPPGDYEFDIILRDVLAEGATATQTVPFTIIPTPKAGPGPDGKGPDGSGDPPGPAGKPSSKKGKGSRPPRPR